MIVFDTPMVQLYVCDVNADAFWYEQPPFRIVCSSS